MKLHVRRPDPSLSGTSAAIPQQPYLLRLAICSGKRRSAGSYSLDLDLCARSRMARGVRYSPPRAAATMTPASVVTSLPHSSWQEHEATLGPLGRSLIQHVEVINIYCTQPLLNLVHRLQ